ncbi:MAG: hypothetical protein WA751_10255 [Candidatus Dormiibacterota bacterium]
MGDTLTITLTGRPPVRITKADWPITASATGRIEWHDDLTDPPDFWLYVREHADGRTMVSGIVNYPTHSGWEQSRGGQLIGRDADLTAVITAVAEELAIPESVAQKCLADLPAEVI